MYLEKKMTLKIDGLGKSEKVTFRKGEGGHIFIKVNGVEESVSVEDFIDILNNLFDLTIDILNNLFDLTGEKL